MPTILAALTTKHLPACTLPPASAMLPSTHRRTPQRLHVTHLVQRALRGGGVQRRVVVDVGVAQGAAGHRVTAHADGGHGADLQGEWSGDCQGGRLCRHSSKQAGPSQLPTHAARQQAGSLPLQLPLESAHCLPAAAGGCC